MSQRYSLIGGWWLRNGEQSFWLKIGAGAWVENTLDVLLEMGAAGGYAYPTADGNGDDITYILTQDFSTAIAAYPGVTLNYLEVVVVDQDTGILGLRWYDTDGLGTISIRFDHPTDPDNNNNSYFLHDLLRMTSTPTSVISIATGSPGTLDGSRAHGYSLRPTVYMMTDLDEYEARVSQAVPDSGMVQTLRTSVRTRHRIGIRLGKAYPRGAVFNEYHQLVDFMTHAATGRPFRLYPDRTLVTTGTAFAEASAPFGYTTLVLDKDSASWRPEPASGNWYKVMDSSLLAWEV